MKRKLVYCQHVEVWPSFDVCRYVCVDEGDKAQEYLENARLSCGRKEFEYVTDRKRVYTICDCEGEPIGLGEQERCFSMQEGKEKLRKYRKDYVEFWEEGGENPSELRKEAKDKFYLLVWCVEKTYKGTEDIFYGKIKDVTGWSLEDFSWL